MTVKKTKAMMLLLDNILDKEGNDRYTRDSFKKALSLELDGELVSEKFISRLKNELEVVYGIKIGIGDF